MTWLFWTLGALIALAGLTLLYRALFADRARGRKRCPKCWYDMAGVAPQDPDAPSADWSNPIPCPECGRHALRPRELRRTRRRWGRASLALVVLVIAAAVTVAPYAAETTPISVLPRPVLVLLYDTLSDDRRQETYERFVAEINDLSRSERRALGRMWADRFIARSRALPSKPVIVNALVTLPPSPAETAQVLILLGPDMTPGVEALLAAIPTLPDDGAEAFHILAEYAPSDPAFCDFYMERIRTGAPEDVVRLFYTVGQTEFSIGAVASRVEDDPASVRPMLAALDDAPVSSMYTPVPLTASQRQALDGLNTSSDLVLAILQARNGHAELIAAIDAFSEEVLADLEYEAIVDQERRPELLSLLLDARDPVVVLVSAPQDPVPAGASEALDDLLARVDAPEFAATLERLLGSYTWPQSIGGPSWRNGAPDLTRRVLREARDPEVRAVCLRSIIRAPEAFHDAVDIAINALRSDPDYNVRIEAALLCTQLAPTDELAGVMREAARADEEGPVRIILESHLESNGRWR